MSEQREILRRIAERGLTTAQRGCTEGEKMGGYPEASAANDATYRAHEQHLDLWQHMLDEITRLPSEDKT